MSEMTLGVAENEGSLPGTVLSPNADFDQTLESPSLGMEQFGQQLERPDADPVTPAPAPSADAGRFEYWQSKAQAQEAENKRLQVELAERMKMDPVVNLIKSDEDTFNYVKSKLGGQRAPAAPVEAPQKPSDYNEVEAFSNPESASWKYRKTEEQYRDQMLRMVKEQNERLVSEREQMLAYQQQEVARRESLKKFREEAVNKGVPEDKFTEFFQMVNSASLDNMVEFFNFKTGKVSSPSAPKFPGSLSGPGTPAPRKNETMDIGNEMITLSRRL